MEEESETTYKFVFDMPRSNCCYGRSGGYGRVFVRGGHPDILVLRIGWAAVRHISWERLLKARANIPWASQLRNAIASQNKATPKRGCEGVKKK